MAGQMLGNVSDARARIVGAGGVGFRSVGAMREAAAAQRARSREVDAPGRGVFFTAEGEGDAARLVLDLGGATAEGFSPWALRQVGTIAGVPGGVLDRLSPPTAARVLNETWPREGDEGGPRRFLVESPEGAPSVLRAVTSTGYRRVWDADLLGEVDRWLVGNGWQAAYPTINHGGTPEADRERALWRSDRDSFAFFMGPRNGATDDGLGGMRRGLFVGNSETGGRSLSWGNFWFRDVCSNFLVWDARDVSIRRRRHTAGIVGEVADLRRWIREAVPATTAPDLVPFEVLNRTAFDVTGAKGPDRTWEERFAEVVADRFDLTRALARKAADLAARNENGARAGSWWAAVNGVTAAARDLTPGDRFDASVAAGRMVAAGLAVAGR